MSAVLHPGAFPAYGLFAYNGNLGAPTEPSPCTPTSILSAYDGQFPLSYSLETVMYGYWVVKSYRLSGTLFFTPASGSPEYSYDYDHTFESQVSDESELVCGNQGWSGEEFGVNITLLQFMIPPIRNPNPYGPNIYRTGTIYWPQFYFRDDEGAADAFWTTDPNDGGSLVDAEIRVYLNQFDRPPTFVNVPLYAGSSYASVNGSLDFEMDSFWPYDPGDGGGPIWDTVTGLSIRPDMLNAAAYIRPPAT